MTATIIYTPQLKERVFEYIPFSRENAVTPKALLPHFPENTRDELTQACQTLRKFGVVECEWEPRPKGGRQLLYWRPRA